MRDDAMTLTPEDLKQIGEVVDERIDRSLDRIADAVTEKLEANSLGDMKRDIASLNERVDSMAEDLTKVVERTEEIPHINRRLRNLEERI